jgi:hypothetical protein
LDREEVYQLPQCVPEPDGLTRPARPAVGALHEYTLAHEPVTAEHWQHIFAVLREENDHFQAKIVRLVRSCGMNDDALVQLAWDKREEWEAAGYVPPAAGRQFHETLFGLAAGDLVFEEEQP